MSGKRKTTAASKRRTFRKRDYRREYAARIARGLQLGKSRSAARGHPRAADLPRPPPMQFDRFSPLELALSRMRRGESQASAARAEGVTVEQLRRHRLLHTSSERTAGKWIIFDTRPQLYRMASKGREMTVLLAREDGTELSAYWRAVNRFLATNRVEHLAPFVGRGVTDVNGTFHQFETGPNVLRKLDAVGELNFLDIYASVAL